MSQLINVAITNESAKVQSRLEINFAPIVKLAWGASEEVFPWLRSIDEYGVTYLNARQAMHAARELKMLDAPTELASDIEMLIKTLENVETHTLVAFFGD